LQLFNRPAAELKVDEPQSSSDWLLRAGQHGSMLLGFSAILLVWIGAIYFSYSEWVQTDRAARQTAENLTRALEEQVIRTIGAADQTLLYVRDFYAKDPQHFDISFWTHDTQFLAGIVTQVAIIDQNGKLVADNIPGARLGIDLSDREHFTVHAARQSDELYISKPLLGRISRKWTIQLTRRITMQDGSFGGVVVVSLDPQYISNVYRSIDIGKEGTVTLVGSDGIIRARRAIGPSLVGMSLTGAKVFEELLKSNAGFYTTTSLTDNVERIFAYRKVNGLPLIITVGLARGEVFQVSEQNRQRHFAIAGLLTVWLFGATFLMGRYQEILARARDAAENGTRARSEFLAMMSHEIRTPMNGVIGMADFLLDSRLSKEQFHYVSTLRESATHLLKIINDVLDFSKLEIGQIQTEKIPFKIHHLVKATVALFDAYAREKDLALTVAMAADVPQAIIGDPGRLRQVLLNFVGNGLKFTKVGGVTVTVAVEAAAGKNRLAFTIADTGIGIPQDAIPLLFRKFSQLDSTIARRFGGTGLGLAICKRLIDIMGGSVTVASEVGRGTTFTFTIDYVPTSPAAVETEWGQRPLLKVAAPADVCRKRLRVLLVEDNKTNQLVATKLIESLGHSVDLADNGPNALTACQAIEYDVIFLDVMMPGMDGLAVAKAIRKLKPPFCNPHIIAFTANVQKHHMKECRAAGMDDFLAKPVTRGELAAKLAPLSGAAPQASPALIDAEPRPHETFDRAIFDELAAALGPDDIELVLRHFMADTADRLREMRLAAAGGNSDGVARSAHAAKSAAGNLGFMHFSDLAATLESDAIDLSPPILDDRLAALEHEFADIRTIVRTQLERAVAEPSICPK
jgi:signal transduction histidine kinase/HPt (histidine-containing phosphotransfer) domain-containing protein/ActR/RegA family two-component response regulator